MNTGQEKFLSYILERTRPDRMEAARSYLMDNFARQAEGDYAREDALSAIPVILGFLRPEHVEEVGAIMAGFAADPRP